MKDILDLIKNEYEGAERRHLTGEVFLEVHCQAGRVGKCHSGWEEGPVDPNGHRYLLPAVTLAVNDLVRLASERCLHGCGYLKLSFFSGRCVGKKTGIRATVPIGSDTK